jgi:hypothetical protein
MADRRRDRLARIALPATIYFTPRPLPASPKLSLADSAKIKDKFPFGHLPARN